MKITSIIMFLFFAISISAQDFTQSPYQGYSLTVPLVADFDGDDNLDVLGRQSSSVVLQINNATSPISFTEKNLNLNFDFSGRAYAKDMDNDNDIDVVAAQGSELHLFILKNDGNANFTLDSLGISGANLLKLEDIDNDNDIDIIGMNSSTNSLYIFFNDGNQNFTSSPIVENSSNLEAFDLSDMDNDGDIDIVLGYDQFSGDQIIMYKNNGGTNFEYVNILSSSFSSLSGLIVDDIDSDGKNDVLAFKTFSCTTFINQGNDTYESQNVASANNFIRSIRTGDYNGDGKKDIILGTNSGDISWFENSSNAPLNFENGVVVGSVAPAFSIINGDLDNDNDTDIVVSNGEFWWYENNIIQGVIPLTLTSSNTNVLCNGDATGSISLTISGGTPPFTYTWSDNSLSGSNLTNLPAGNYDVTITDSASETITESFTIQEPPVLEGTTQSSPEVDNNGNGSANINVIGGVAPYSYLWNDSNNQTTPEATNLSAGNYKVVVTDANACTIEKIIMVDMITDIKNESKEKIAIQISPNPITDYFNLEISGMGDNVLLMIFSIEGKLILEQSIAKGLPRTIYLSNLRAGFYFIKLQDENGNICSEKIMFEK